MSPSRRRESSPVNPSAALQPLHPCASAAAWARPASSRFFRPFSSGRRLRPHPLLGAGPLCRLALTKSLVVPFVVLNRDGPAIDAGFPAVRLAARRGADLSPALRRAFARDL